MTEPSPGQRSLVFTCYKNDLGHSSIPRWYGACVRLDDRAYSEGFAVEQGLRHVCVLAPLLLNIFFAAAINVAYMRFKPDKYTMDALVHLRENEGRGGGGNQPP